MDVPEGVTSSYSFTILPGKSNKITIPEGVEFCLAQLTVSPESSIQNGRVTIYANVNQSQDIALATLLIGKSETAETVLYFASKDEIVFHSAGADAPVQIIGFLTGGFDLKSEEI